MRPTAQALYDPRTEDETEAVLDENLHFGRCWHRYRYCFRRSERLRILDVGCGAGRASLAAARLNPGATVLGIDPSASAVELATRRGEASGIAGLTFAVHDPADPLPADWGRFDFVVCRGVLGRADDPSRLLADLANVLAPGGLMLVSFPSEAGRNAARTLRRAVDVLTPGDEPLGGRAKVGLDLVQSLRPDHPVHARPEGGFDPEGSDDPLRTVLDALSDDRDWTLAGAEALLAENGLALRYAATPWAWRTDRVFSPGTPAGELQRAVERLDPAARSRLIDALDPAALGPEYQLYVGPRDDTPAPPAWVLGPRDDADAFGRLVPHFTGLARLGHAPAAGPGRTPFRMVSGAPGELDRISSLRIALVDGRSSCADIDRKLAASTRASDNARTLRDCWVNLADSGLILLEELSDSPL